MYKPKLPLLSYYRLSSKTRYKHSILLGKIARFFINLQPICNCGCDRSANTAKWIALGFDIDNQSEISITFKDGSNCIDVLPKYGKVNTYPKIK